MKVLYMKNNFLGIKMTKNKKAYLLWDGDCGVCDYAIRKITPYIDKNKIEILPYQFADDIICPPEIRIQCTSAIHFRTVTGKYTKATRALADTFRLSGHKITYFIMVFPGIHQLLNVGYYLVARNRKTISKWFGLNACRVPSR